MPMIFKHDVLTPDVNALIFGWQDNSTNSIRSRSLPEDAFTTEA